LVLRANRRSAWKKLRANENEEDGIFDGYAERDGGEARGEIEVRSEGDLAMKFWSSPNIARASNNASFETLAAAQQIAAVTSGAVSAAVLGRGVGAFADELAGKAVNEVCRVSMTCSPTTPWTDIASR